MMYRIAAINPARWFLNISCANRYMPIIAKNPEATETRRPDRRGSETTLIIVILSQTKEGCFPSVREIKRQLASKRARRKCCKVVWQNMPQKFPEKEEFD